MVANGIASAPISFSPKGLTTTIVTASPTSVTYGQPVTLTATVAASSDAYTPQGTVQFVVDGRNSGSAVTLSNGTVSVSDASLPAGLPTIIAIFTGTDGISISSSGTLADGLTIQRAPLTITAVDESKTYGQALTFGAADFTTSTLFNGDAVTSVTLTTAGAAATATVTGSPYSIVPSNAAGSGLSNYTISYEKGSLAVNPAALLITADDETKTYGKSFTLLRTQITTGTLYNSDSVISVTLSSLGAPAAAAVSGSPYPITPSAAVGIGLSNYAITYANGNLTVNPAALTITPVDESKIYGQAFTFLGTEFTTETLFNGDTVTGVTLSSPGAPATALASGLPYPIIASAASGSGINNYAITYVTGSFTVTAAPLVITADDQTKTYGQSFTFASTEFSAGTLYNGDTISSVGFFSSGVAATASVAESPYPITLGSATGTGLGNYRITYEEGSLTVTAAPLVITADDQTKTYGQVLSFSGTEFTTGTLYNGDSVSSVTLSSPGAAAAAVVTGSPDPITPSEPLRRPRKLRHHLRQWQPHHQPRSPDHHCSEPDQDLRDRACVCGYRVRRRYSL